MGRFSTPGILYWSAFIPSTCDGAGNGAVSDIGQYSYVAGKSIISRVVGKDGGGSVGDLVSPEVRQSDDVKMTEIEKGLAILQEDKSAMDCSVGWTISSRCNIPINQYKAHTTFDFPSVITVAEEISSALDKENWSTKGLMYSVKQKTTTSTKLSSPDVTYSKQRLSSSSLSKQTTGKDVLMRKPSLAYNQDPFEDVIKVDALDIIINGPKDAFINESIELTIIIVNNSLTEEFKKPTLMTEREYLKHDSFERGECCSGSSSQFHISRSYLVHTTSILLRYSKYYSTQS